MGIDIAVQGRITSKTRRGEAAAAFLLDLAGQFWGEDLLESGTAKEGGATQIYLLVHPLGEALQIDVQGNGLIQASARTNTVGPGYHERICEFFHHLGAGAGIEWESDPAQDETGFFTTGDRGELERAMLEWLSNVCRVCLEQAGERNASIGISMPVEPHFLYDAPVRTPTGPRTLAWARAVAENPQAPEAREFFSSWTADRSAGELLNRALAHMWLDLYWVAPQSEESEDRMERSADLLAEAYRMDPTLDYPWAEWAEILECLERDDDALAPMVRQQAEGLTPTIGYRRQQVLFRELPGDWHITLPGRFEAGVEDEGETWVAEDDRSAVEITTFQIQEGGQLVNPVELIRNDAPEVPLLDEWREGRHHGAAAILQLSGEGEEYQVISAWIAAGRHLAGITISAPEDAQAPWIIDALHSVTAPEDEE
jgi:hypothetical protein